MWQVRCPASARITTPLRAPVVVLAAQPQRGLTLTLETCVRTMAHTGQHQWVWILDMKGYTRANSPPLSVSLATLRVLADHCELKVASNGHGA